MRAWTGTRVPAKTGVPLRISGDEVTIGSAMALPYSRSFLRLKGAEHYVSAATRPARRRLHALVRRTAATRGRRALRQPPPQSRRSRPVARSCWAPPCVGVGVEDGHRQIAFRGGARGLRPPASPWGGRPGKRGTPAP